MNNENNNNDNLEKEKNNSSNNDDKKRKGIFGRFKKVKHIELILAGVAVLIMLIIFFSSGQSLGCFGSCGGESTASGGQNNSQTGTQGENHLQRIERELNEALSRVDGAGETRVIINWENSIELVLAWITNESSNSSSSSPQLVQIPGGGQGPIVIKEIFPRALGVIIITQGGDSPRVQFAMTSAVSTLLDIPVSRIQILTATR